MISNRIRSLELMKALQPFTQTGTISGAQAKDIVSAYNENNLEPLRDFVFSPSIPMAYTSLLEGISRDFLN